MNSPKPKHSKKMHKFKFAFNKGIHSQLWLVEETPSSTLIAAKVFQKLEILTKMTKSRFMWELKVHSHLKHHFFPTFFGVDQSERECIIFMEFINGPNFYEFESILPALTADQGAFYIGQIVLILEYLHMNMILYRDLKPENLMVQKDGYLKLVDFGCAKKLKGHFSKTFTLCGSPEFQAPEIVLNKGHGFPADYWALGIFIYELFAYQSPFFNENPMVHYKNIIRGNFSFPRLFPKKAMDLVTELLVKDPKKRNFKIFDGFNKIKANNFFNNLNWQKLRTKELVAPYFPKKYDLKEIEPYMVVPNANNKNNIKFTIDNYKNW